jgi:isoleucyl-tRNA synthetase
MQTDSHGRRSAQSAMYRIVEAMVRWLAPVLSFTAEEIWPLVPGERDTSVLFETFYDGLAATQAAPAQRASWNDLLTIRAAVAKLLEGMRAAGEIGAALEAEVILHADSALHARLAPLADELRFFFITSGLHLDGDKDVPANAQKVEIAGAGSEPAVLWISAKVAEGQKCIRCWHRREDVGAHAEHPEICGRCVDNLPGGPGEKRQYF